MLSYVGRIYDVEPRLKDRLYHVTKTDGGGVTIVEEKTKGDAENRIE